MQGLSADHWRKDSRVFCVDLQLNLFSGLLRCYLSASKMPAHHLVKYLKEMSYVNKKLRATLFVIRIVPINLLSKIFDWDRFNFQVGDVKIATVALTNLLFPKSYFPSLQLPQQLYLGRAVLFSRC